MTEEPGDQDTDMEFFRLVNKTVSPAEETKMAVKAALELAFGDEAETYWKRLGNGA